jgi:hypothetical protein
MLCISVVDIRHSLEAAGQTFTDGRFPDKSSAPRVATAGHFEYRVFSEVVSVRGAEAGIFLSMAVREVIAGARECR